MYGHGTSEKQLPSTSVAEMGVDEVNASVLQGAGVHESVGNQLGRGVGARLLAGIVLTCPACRKV